MDENEALFMGETKATLERCLARLDKVEKDHETLHSLAVSVERMVDEVKRINTRLGILESETKELTGKSGKRWDNLVDKIIWAVAGGFVSAVLLKLGFGG